MGITLFIASVICFGASNWKVRWVVSPILGALSLLCADPYDRGLVVTAAVIYGLVAIGTIASFRHNTSSHSP